MAWIKLTTPNGSEVQISVEQLVRVRIPVAGEAPAQTNALVDLTNGQSQATRESLEEIMQLLSTNNQQTAEMSQG